ncbi:hypothetical protein D3C84_822850 [compost metagenome]
MPSAVAQFAVAIVFNDPALVGRGPFDQLQASAVAQGDAQRVLTRGGGEHQAGVGAVGDALLDIDALVVDTHRYDLAAVGLEGDARGDMAGIFHPYRVVGVEQQHAQQVEGLLGAGNDHHLLGTAVDAAGIEHIVGDGPTQILQALQLAIAEHRLARFLHMTADQTLPDKLGKGFECAMAG